MRLFKQLAGSISATDQPGTFRPGLPAWHAGLALWLLAAGRLYQSQPVTSWLSLGIAAALMAAVLAAAGLPRDFSTRPLAALARLAGAIAGLMVLRLGLAALTPDPAGWREALWFGVVLGSLATLSHLGLLRVAAAPTPARAGIEALRWLVLGGLTAGVYTVLHTDTPSGAGDAYWYRIMLADFIAQGRAGGLPVWVGQTEYAFNGAVIPLRMAPWFQHAGALVDRLTGGTLHYVAVANLVLALNALAGAFSAYFCFRAILPRQPWSAVALAFLFVASPGVMAPLTNCDQYMTFLTAPLLPVAGYALWRVCSRDRIADWLMLAATLAALWQTHSPIALCSCCFAAAGGGARLLLRPGFPWRWAGLALAVFLPLGTLPFASVLDLGIAKVDVPLVGGGIDYDMATVFAPLTKTFQFYQPGFSALLLGGLGLGVFLWRRTLAAGIFLGLVTVLMVFVLPIPGVNDFVWNQVPRVVMQVLNLWPMQRLVGLWVVLMLTLGAGSLALLESARRTWLPAAGLWGLLVPAALWTGWQTTYLAQHLRETTARADTWRSAYEKHNLVLSRYAFNPFPTLPGYFSHGYIDPVLEHRLLRPDLTPILSNADSAVRRGPAPAPDADGTARLAHGTWRAVNDRGSAFYNLNPALALPAQQHLALRLEPLDPGQTGWLQLIGADLFREYILPDSGAGGNNRPARRGFGTLPGNSGVISLYTRQPLEPMLAINIAPDRKPAATDFDFARYELWRYDPAELPVAVMSWAPYHLIVHSPEAGYLETPRAWLPHYRAKINSQRVYGTRSPEGLLLFAVPAGRSDISIKYVPPLWLELAYWVALAGWLAVLAAGLRWLLSAATLSGSLPAGR